MKSGEVTVHSAAPGRSVGTEKTATQREQDRLTDAQTWRG